MPINGCDIVKQLLVSGELCDGIYCTFTTDAKEYKNSQVVKCAISRTMFERLLKEFNSNVNSRSNDEQHSNCQCSQ